MSGPGPQRGASWNPIRDTVGRVREIAGRAAGGSLTDEARRQRPGGSGGRQFFAPGGDIFTSETHHTSQTLWTASPLPVPAGRSRLLAIRVYATGVTPGAIGTVGAGSDIHATAPANHSGAFAATIAWPSWASSLTFYLAWPTAESGTLNVTILDPG